MTVLELRCAIEFRADESRQSPGRIVGTLMEYETRAGDRPEMFAAGSLSWPEGGIILNEQHNRQAPLMRFRPEARDGKVVIDAALPDTQRGRDAATMVRNGTFRGLSVEFRAQDETMRGGVRLIRKAALAAAALVDDPAYPASAVEVRTRAAGRRTPRWL
ncbi:MAG: HK97 family phage prohead protease [Rhodospirillaceae bacterium]|nr:HK97 family phage prohead protease [Rhodospirillaceae bacterium]